jgi:hypothetical protein
VKVFETMPVSPPSIESLPTSHLRSPGAPSVRQ